MRRAVSRSNGQTSLSSISIGPQSAWPSATKMAMLSGHSIGIPITIMGDGAEGGGGRFEISSPISYAIAEVCVIFVG